MFVVLHELSMFWEIVVVLRLYYNEFSLALYFGDDEDDDDDNDDDDNDDDAVTL